MRPALFLLAALPLIVQTAPAQPKLLVNAKVDIRPASAGLEREFKALQSAQPQPAWIGYEVPAVRGVEMGCEYVRDGGAITGIVHLEPPDHAVILFRVEGNTVNKLRNVSPDCEIDAGGLPLHWLTDVVPSQSVALLATFVPQHELDSNGALGAIAAHADPSANAVLDRYLERDQPEWVRRRVASLEASERGAHGVEMAKKVIANDVSESVKQGAISGLSRNKEPEALAVLIAAARTAQEPRTRSLAISSLNRKPGQAVVDTINAAIANDPDVQVRRRAVDALGSLPDGAGVPALIQLVKSSKDPDVRKQAMNRLQNSHDSRAEAFFEEVLK